MAITAASPKGQPVPPTVHPTRYAPGLPFPAYRHTPGLTPHPRHHRDGHSHGLPEPEADLTEPGGWAGSRAYLFAIDLFNRAYWWECHEVLESLWIRAGRRGPQALFFQAIIQAAAANIKWHAGNGSAARFLAGEATKKLRVVIERMGTETRRYMGVDVEQLIDAVECFYSTAEGGAWPPTIELSAGESETQRAP